MTKSEKVDILNIFLILTSGIISFFFPLQTFVLAFFILGPLHYFTEINWLSSQSFFTKNTRPWFLMSLISSFWIISPMIYFHYHKIDNTLITKIFLLLSQFSHSIILIVLLLSISFNFFKNIKRLPILIIALGLFAGLLVKQSVYLIGMFTPTFIHVYVFTLLFMLYGAKKQNSFLSYISIAIALLVPILYIFIPVNKNSYTFPNSITTVFTNNNFHLIPLELGKYLGILKDTTFNMYDTVELKLLMFLSFSYLYHYLNWFSKTTTIKWHKNINTKKTILITSCYITTLVLIITNFKIGFFIALFFSFFHVFLEFPLNIKSIVALFKR